MTHVVKPGNLYRYTNRGINYEAVFTPVRLLKEAGRNTIIGSKLWEVKRVSEGSMWTPNYDRNTHSMSEECLIKYCTFLGSMKIELDDVL